MRSPRALPARSPEHNGHASNNGRFFDDAIHPDVSPLDRAARRYSVEVNLRLGHGHQRHRRLPRLPGEPDELPDGRFVRIDHVVPEKHAEPFGAHRVPRGKHGVPEPERLLLAHADQTHRVADPPHLFEQLLLPLALQLVLQLVCAVEVVLDGALPAPVDQHHLLRSRRKRLLDDELDGRRVDDRQHLLGDRLGGGQEPGAQAGGRDHDLAQGMIHRTSAGPRR